MNLVRNFIKFIDLLKIPTESCRGLELLEKQSVCYTNNSYHPFINIAIIDFLLFL
jgi:hypothetical protein